MIRNCFFLSLLLFLVSCSHNNPKEIPLFNGITFFLHEGESVSGRKPKLKDTYSAYFNSQTIQIPLFKCIEHKGYVIFIGIPYNTGIEEMISNRKSIPDSLQVRLTSGSNFYFASYIKDGKYITELSRVVNKSSLIFLATIAENKELSDSLLNATELTNRLKVH